MALFGSFATLRAQAPQTPGFLAAFAYVAEARLTGSPADLRLRAMVRGESQKIDLGAGAVAIEQVYETKARPEGFFESHRKYIDVQVVIEGEELMEVIDASRMAVREAYNSERDLIIYTDAPDASHLRIKAGDAAIFFPVDVHMPSLRVDAAAVLVRKTVIKIPVTT